EGAHCKLHQQESLFSDIGMELPSLLKLKALMINAGYYVNDKAGTEEELADEIARVVCITSSK
ncbi:MAG TPA: hypothetical protein VJL62_04760, partial [Thermodesulfobacteriota bacterium]|nr:hypothetical protein [Thermodesulfobacteriota bacterium]